MRSKSATCLLVTDVDETLLGDDVAYGTFVEAVGGSPGIAVALNSSRPVASVHRSLAGVPPPFEPAAIVGAMGTEIYFRGRLLDRWSARFGGWTRKPIDDVMERLGFDRHNDEFQTPLKASFDVPHTRRKVVERSVREIHQPCKIVWSGKRDCDILPPNADKGDATLHVADLLGVALEDLIVAGDSANDVAMFEVARKGIVVGNARDELRRAVGPKRAFHATQPHAAGLIEGLLHYHVPLNT